MSNYNDKKKDTTMNPTLAIKVTSLVKYHLSTNMKSKLLEQSVERIQNFHQLADKLFSNMQVSSILSQLFFMHYLFF